MRNGWIRIIVFTVVVVVLVVEVWVMISESSADMKSQEEMGQYSNEVTLNSMASNMDDLETSSFNGTVMLPGGVELKMVKIRGGSFKMGSQNGYNDELPVHTVKLTQNFWMGIYEVTQEQYKAIQ